MFDCIVCGVVCVAPGVVCVIAVSWFRFAFVIVVDLFFLCVMFGVCVCL